MKNILVAVSLMIASFLCLAESEVGRVNHIGLAVKDLAASEAFFVEYGGFEAFGHDPEYPAAFMDNGHITITLWQVEDPATATPFHRRKNIGLHHLALEVATMEGLYALYEQLKQDPSVEIEFAPEFMGNGPSKHMMVYEPSGIRIEFMHRVPRVKD